MTTIDKLLAGKPISGHKNRIINLRSCLSKNRVYVAQVPSDPFHGNDLFKYEIGNVVREFMPLHEDYIIATGFDVYMVNRTGDLVQASVVSDGPRLTMLPYILSLDLLARTYKTEWDENTSPSLEKALERNAFGMFAAFHLSNLIAQNNIVEHSSSRPYTFSPYSPDRSQIW